MPLSETHPGPREELAEQLMNSATVGMLSGHFLGDPEEIKKAQEAVANQSKARYNAEEKVAA